MRKADLVLASRQGRAMSDPLSRLLASLVPTEQQQPAVPSQDQLNSLLASLQTPQAPSFAQTVTLLSQLVQDSTFVDAVQTLKRDQDEQELRFKDERYVHAARSHVLTR